MPRIESTRCSNAQFVILHTEDEEYESIQVPKQWGELIMHAVNTLDGPLISSRDINPSLSVRETRIDSSSASTKPAVTTTDGERE